MQQKQCLHVFIKLQKRQSIKPRHGTKKACYIAKLCYNVYGVDCILPHASEDDAYHVFFFFLTACVKMYRQHMLCT